VDQGLPVHVDGCVRGVNARSSTLVALCFLMYVYVCTCIHTYVDIAHVLQQYLALVGLITM